MQTAFNATSFCSNSLQLKLVTNICRFIDTPFGKVTKFSELFNIDSRRIQKLNLPFTYTEWNDVFNAQFMCESGM